MNSRESADVRDPRESERPRAWRLPESDPSCRPRCSEGETSNVGYAEEVQGQRQQRRCEREGEGGSKERDEEK